MKRNTTIILNIASLLIICDAIGIGFKLIVFLFAGVIPFTNITLSPTQMMYLMAISFCLVVSRVGIMPLIKRVLPISTKRIKVSSPSKRLNRSRA